MRRCRTEQHRLANCKAGDAVCASSLNLGGLWTPSKSSIADRIQTGLTSNNFVVNHKAAIAYMVEHCSAACHPATIWPLQHESGTQMFAVCEQPRQGWEQAAHAQQAWHIVPAVGQPEGSATQSGASQHPPEAKKVGASVQE